MSISAQNTIAAFSEDHAVRLTGVTKTQLRYWDRTDFFVPTYAEQNRRMPFSRVYSFKDIVALRVLNVLRNQFRVSLHQLRDVNEKLSERTTDRWTGVRLYVLNKKVIWNEPGTALPQEIASGQYIVPVELDDVLSSTDQDVAAMKARDKAKVGKIEQHRYVGHNAPVIGGTRIPVSAIKNFASAGYSNAQILAEYPDLTEEDIKAAIAYEHAAAA
jgi:uncharacterized protein (DUF433 family)